MSFWRENESLFYYKFLTERRGGKNESLSPRNVSDLVFLEFSSSLTKNKIKPPGYLCFYYFAKNFKSYLEVELVLESNGLYLLLMLKPRLLNISKNIVRDI